MAVGVEEHAIFDPICPTFASPDHMMTMPSGNLRDSLVAHWAFAVLFLPQMQELSLSGQVLLCFHVETFFKVCFPSRVEWVGCSLNRSMPLDFHSVRSSQMNKLGVSLFILDFSCEHPVIRALCPEVFLLHPGCAFSWMSPSGPPPHLFKDSIVHGVEGFATGTKPMVVGPSPYYRIELYNQLPSRAVL